MGSRIDSSRPKVLAVEDDADILSFLKDCVHSQDMTFRGVATGREGVQAAQEWKPDLVLLDISLPDTTGLEVLKKIRAEQKDRVLPVIFLTSEKGIRIKAQALGLGADDYLTKPISPVELAARIKVQYRTKRLQEELQEKNRQLKNLEDLRQSLTQFIVHDQRNHLMSLGMGLEMCMTGLKDGSLDDKKLKYCLSNANRTVTRLRSMVDNLLDLSKLEEEKFPVKLKPCAPGELLEGCRSQVQEYAALEKVRLCVETPKESSAVLADKDLVLRVLWNLTGNAFKFAGTEKKQVTLSAHLDRGKNEFIFSIEDNGMGIPEDLLEKIFDKFFRARREENCDVSGTGLGLAFCKSSIEAQNGRIWAESEMGKGSRFCFTLQVAP